MTGTQFTPDSSRAGPGRPSQGKGQGNLDREQRRGQGQQGQGKPQGKSAGASRGDGPQLGFPRAAQPEPDQGQSDFRHVQLLSQHVNMQGLGRQGAFGVRASLTGEYRQILDRSKGQVPFDIFEDW